jgi:hypothetical protein
MFRFPVVALPVPGAITFLSSTIRAGYFPFPTKGIPLRSFPQNLEGVLSQLVRSLKQGTSPRQRKDRVI